tara:strand:- start:748 stop:1266 length:519 start_codon:yes stop_codon:yes gene_type:complete
MKVKNNSIIDTVIDYANVKFGMEVKEPDISKQLKGLSYRDTLRLVDAIGKEDDETFGDIIDLSAMSEAYGSAMTSAPSRATNRASGQNYNNAMRRQDNMMGKQNRAGSGAERTVAGGNKQPTGGSSNAVKRSPDPDDIERQQNSQMSTQNNAMATQNANDIARLKQLALGRR